MSTTATPAKLKDGTWGARVQGSVRAGERITIHSKSGKTWMATVARVLWSGGGVSLCALRSRGTLADPDWCCGCGGPIRSLSYYAADLDRGLCGACAYDDD